MEIFKHNFKIIVQGIGELMSGVDLGSETVGGIHGKDDEGENLS